jgi:hypothetical protein
MVTPHRPVSHSVSCENNRRLTEQSAASREVHRGGFSRCPPKISTRTVLRARRRALKDLLATLTYNTVHTSANLNAQIITITARPTPIHAKAFELLGLRFTSSQ